MHETCSPQLVEVRQYSTGIEVVGDHATSRSQAGPDVGLDDEPGFYGLLGHQACRRRGTEWAKPNCGLDEKCSHAICVVSSFHRLEAELNFAGKTKQFTSEFKLWHTCGEHDRRVAVVGAADDGGDDHGAVRQLILLTAVQEGDADVLLLLGDVEAFKSHLGQKEKLLESSAA